MRTALQLLAIIAYLSLCIYLENHPGPTPTQIRYLHDSP